MPVTLHDFATNTTFTFGDGDVENVTSTLNSNLDHDSMPGSRGGDALLFDFNGVLKVVKLRGRLSNNGVSKTNVGSIVTINEQRQWIEKLINGAQNGLSFDSNYSSIWNGTSWTQCGVLIGSAEWDEVTGDPNSLPFTIILGVGSVV